MKIEVGKTYKDLVGNVSTIMSERHPDVFVNHHGQLFNGWGRALPVRHAANSLDLVAEVNAQGGSAHEPTRWDQNDTANASLEGWGLFTSGLTDSDTHIERDDEAAMFCSDDAAIQFVWRGATSGNELHRRAIAFIKHHNPGEYAEMEKLMAGDSKPTPDDVRQRMENRQPTIPHADLIRAVLDGKAVQFKSLTTGEWADDKTALYDMINYPRYEFRLKPEPKVQWCVLWPNGDVSEGYPSKLSLNQTMSDNEAQDYTKVLRLELDPDTLEVLNAKTEAP